jgi:hypothetical protein
MAMTESSSAIIEQPTREELAAAWHRCSPNLTYEQADASFNGWRLGASIFAAIEARPKRAI